MFVNDGETVQYSMSISGSLISNISGYLISLGLREWNELPYHCFSFSFCIFYFGSFKNDYIFWVLQDQSTDLSPLKCSAFSNTITLVLSNLKIKIRAATFSAVPYQKSYYPYFCIKSLVTCCWLLTTTSIFWSSRGTCRCNLPPALLPSSCLLATFWAPT